MKIKKLQVRWDDQSQYHQGLESVFVGGRLSALLPHRASVLYKWLRRIVGIARVRPLETGVGTHTHT